VSRVKLPEFIHEVIDDPRQRGILMAGSLAMFAVGLTPRVLSPGLPTAQEALRSQPDLQNFFLLLAFAGTATIILGGLVSDVFRRRILLVGGLALMLVGAVIGLLVPDGPIFIGANFISIAATGVVLAYAITAPSVPAPPRLRLCSRCSRSCSPATTRLSLPRSPSTHRWPIC